MTEQGTDLARRNTARQELMSQVRSADFAAQIEAALPEGVTVKRFARTAVTAILENSELAKLDRDSVFASILKSAADGLLPDGREAALVPFKGKAIYIPMIGGFRKIAAEYGWALRTAAVYADDLFEWEAGETPHVLHRPSMHADRGDIVAAYAVAKHTPTGELELEVMRADEIEKVRATSKAKQSDAPWQQWPERMAEKTVGRRLFKKLPLGDRERVRRVLNADELTPAAAEVLAYGPPREKSESPERSTGEPKASEDSPSEQEAPRQAGQPAEQESEPPAATFTEPEPPAPADEELEAAMAYVMPEGRYEGTTLGAIAHGGDVEYLEWLTTDAVTIDELRAAAAKVLESVTS